MIVELAVGRLGHVKAGERRNFLGLHRMHQLGRDEDDQLGFGPCDAPLADPLGQERDVSRGVGVDAVLQEAGDGQRLPFPHLDGRGRGPDLEARRAVDGQAAVDLTELRRDLQADAVLIHHGGQEADDRSERPEVRRHRVEPRGADDGRHGELATGDERGRVATERDEGRLAEKLDHAVLRQGVEADGDVVAVEVGQDGGGGLSAVPQDGVQQNLASFDAVGRVDPPLQIHAKIAGRGPVELGDLHAERHLLHAGDAEHVDDLVVGSAGRAGGIVRQRIRGLALVDAAQAIARAADAGSSAQAAPLGPNQGHDLEGLFAVASLPANDQLIGDQLHVDFTVREHLIDHVLQQLVLLLVDLHLAGVRLDLDEIRHRLRGGVVEPEGDVRRALGPADERDFSRRELHDLQHAVIDDRGPVNVLGRAEQLAAMHLDGELAGLLNDFKMLLQVRILIGTGKFIGRHLRLRLGRFILHRDHQGLGLGFDLRWRFRADRPGREHEQFGFRRFLHQWSSFRRWHDRRWLLRLDYLCFNHLYFELRLDDLHLGRFRHRQGGHRRPFEDCQFGRELWRGYRRYRLRGVLLHRLDLRLRSANVLHPRAERSGCELRIGGVGFQPAQYFVLGRLEAYPTY